MIASFSWADVRLVPHPEVACFGATAEGEQSSRTLYGTRGMLRAADGRIGAHFALRYAPRRPANPNIPGPSLSLGPIVVCDVGPAMMIGCVGLHVPSIL